ncbi:MAG: site-specific integrase, partial [Terriglobales bacterium]
MSRRQLPNGKWQVDWADEWGKRQRRTVGYNEATAAAIDEELERTTRDARKAIQNFQQGERLSLPEARDIYLHRVGARDITKSHMRQRLGQFIKDAGQTELRAVTPQLVTQWFETRRAALSPQTLWRDLKMLRKWFQWLKEAQYAPANPWA